MLQQITPKQLIIGILIFSIIPAMGMVVSLYTQTWDPLWNPFRPEPEQVLETMAEKVGGAETVHGKVDFALEIENKQKYKVAGTIEGDNATADYKNPKATANFNIVFAAEGMQFSFAAESILVGEESYLKITTIPAFPALDFILLMAGIDSSQIKNQWIRIDEESLKEITGEDEQSQDKEKQERMLTRLKGLLTGKKFFRVQQELGDEKIGQNLTYHYLVILDKGEIKKLMPDLLKIGLEEQAEFQKLSGTEKEKLEEKLKEFPEEFDEFLEKIGDITAEVWIGKKDWLLYRLKTEKEIDLSKFATDEEDKGFIKININADFSNYNQPVKIEAPKNYKTLKEILAPLMEQREKVEQLKRGLEQKQPETRAPIRAVIGGIWLDRGGNNYTLDKEQAPSLFNTGPGVKCQNFTREQKYYGILFDNGLNEKEAVSKLNLTYDKKQTIPVNFKPQYVKYVYAFALGNTGNVYLKTNQYDYEANVLLTINYTDGTSKKLTTIIPWDWSSGRDYILRDVKTIHIKETPCRSSELRGEFYLLKYTNPYPDKIISSITFEDDFTSDYPSTNIFAVTLSNTNIDSITLISPNGGERWVVGQTYNIKWKSVGVAKVKINLVDYSYSSEDAKIIEDNIPAGSGSYGWIIPKDVFTPNWKPGDNYKIGIFEEMPDWIDQPEWFPDIYDESDNYFKIY